MSELPPADEVLDALKYAVAPAAAATAGAALFLGGVVYLACKAASFDWRRFAPAVAVIALAAGVWAGNESRTVFPTAFPPDPEAKSWHWAWVAFELAFLVELIARLPAVGVSVGYLLRGAAAGVIAAFVVPPAVQAEAKWWMPAFAFAVAIQWAVVDAAGRRAPGGWTAAALAAASWAAAAVLIHTHSAGFTDVATFLFSGLAVLAVLAWITGTDAGSAAAAATAPLGCLFVLARHLRDSDVTAGTFLLAAFAPLALGLFLLPGIERVNATRFGGPLKLLAVMLPTAWAVYRAMAEAPLTFGEEW